jgi:hypothetical protein
MTRTNKIFAIGMFGLGVYVSLSVLFGQIPGAGSGIGLLEDMANLISTGIDNHGQVFTSFGIFLLGIFLAMLCLISNDGSSDGGGDWGDSGCGDGGGD